QKVADAKLASLQVTYPELTSCGLPRPEIVPPFSSFPSQPPYNQGTMKKVFHAACPHDCPDACGVLITVEGGRATRIQGDPAHPVTRGFLCGKVAKYLDRVYSPDRVLCPMRRIAPKGLAAATAVAQAGQPRCAPIDRGGDG